VFQDGSIKTISSASRTYIWGSTAVPTRPSAQYFIFYSGAGQQAKGTNQVSYQSSIRPMVYSLDYNSRRSDLPFQGFLPRAELMLTHLRLLGFSPSTHQDPIKAKHLKEHLEQMSNTQPQARLVFSASLLTISSTF
jgi:hypothetical protein